MYEIKMANEVNLTVSNTKVKTMLINYDYIWKSYMNPKLSDVTLLIGNKAYPVLRFVLSMHSTFFEVFFNGNFEEGQKSVVPLDNVKMRPFEVILRYMYSGDLYVDSTYLGDVIDVLSLAHFFEMHVVVQYISDFIEKLPRDDVHIPGLLNKAILLNLEKLKRTITNYILSNQRTFIETELFMLFDEDAILELLDQNKWHVEEHTIAFRVIAWLNQNTKTKQIEEFLQKIRLPMIETRILLFELLPKELYSEEEIYSAAVTRSEKNLETSRCTIEKPNITRIGLSYFYDPEYKCNLKRLIFQLEQHIINRVEIHIPRLPNDCIYFSFQINDNSSRLPYDKDHYVVHFRLAASMTFFFLNVPENIEVHGTDIFCYYRH